MIVIRHYGLLGYIRIFKQESFVLETKTDTNYLAFEVLNPWADLQKFIDSFSLTDT
jgi:hypothetical protein